MTQLQLIDIEKNYGKGNVVSSVNLTVEKGEFVVFVGPSGCGKSTLLRMIAGLEKVTSGQLILEDTVLNDLAPSEREVAMVFQSYALYPHMSVEENMAFPLKMAGFNKEQRRLQVAQTADSLQLTEFLNRLPGELSGGQRQRVAIGRAIVREPRLFLFDEPLSNLDAKLRTEMRLYLKQLHQKLESTMIYVTHDQVEAMTLADKIVVINQGKIEQVGSPEALYNQPVNQFVASFIGSPVMNFLAVEQYCALIQEQQNHDAAHTVGIRPNQVVVDAQTPDTYMKIDVVETLGHARLYYGQLGEQGFIVESTLHYETGDQLPLNLASSILHWFDQHQVRIELDTDHKGEVSQS
ncbi:MULTISPECIES: ABC transporter ATP-binding protein [unclassified Vibrio]|uniref:ABC transporter ATP-binding protein n=1 Tax=Vibrio sp. HB236076 TaxID=3232307 RepID=A0AB39HIL0_9VIBR|nr:sn-glycerol-3-phosphate ABC transporter ATP-binding protein UgpC [Vibrio sp. HB161653]MDP5254995.1 sn-glycerol-3-phosphate ABC transporter ATP-binding protein UgpC [Vibrio sp. HB161653]